jgi:phosphoglycerate dehydrogenase-like enzyme
MGFRECRVRTFRLAISGDFLDEHGKDACGEFPLREFDAAAYLEYRFILEQAPRPGDAGYWRRFYSLEMTARDLRNADGTGIDGLILLRPWLKRSAIESAAETLVVVGRSGAGYDKVDVAACTAADVALFNAPLALNHSTASTALLFLLALAKRLLPQERITRAGRWDRQTAEMGEELLGRTLGIIGLGHSGRELVRLVAPFEMRILAYSPHADPRAAAEMGVSLTSLDTVLRESDFVSVHARPRPENRHLLGAAQFALMRPNAYLVNIARGELVDQAALVDVLKDRRIAGAALDVFEVEPLPPDDPLIQLDNVILTPHWSASTRDVWRATGKAMVDGILRAARGELPEQIVNREVLERPGFRQKLARFQVNAVAGTG